MASTKEVQQNPRPLTHRPSISNTNSSGSLAARASHSRHNSHSVLSASLNANHRVTRRKSMTNTAPSANALAVALQEAADRPTAHPMAINGRRNTMSKPGVVAGSLVDSLPSPPASLPSHRFVSLGGGKSDTQDSAIDDDTIEMSGDEANKGFHAARIRRASDGQPLVKDGRKNKAEIHCQTCGKGYKHSSCLTKHLWEHTPEWSLTSKLLISKHQQVQLLEAASVLVAMNTTSSPPDSAKDFASDQDSASPAASGSSDDHDDRSSADTTPPPQMEGLPSSQLSVSKRYSSGVGGFSRSYQSAPPRGAQVASSMPNGCSFGHFRQESQDQRPPSSGKNTTSQEDQDLATAVELLSCSFNSNNGSRTVHLPPDAPPVPPLPAQYLDQALSGTSFINSFPSRAPESFTRGEIRRDSTADVKMEESGESVTDDMDDDFQSRARSDEDDDGVFGRMEE